MVSKGNAGSFYPVVSFRMIKCGYTERQCVFAIYATLLTQFDQNVFPVSIRKSVILLSRLFLCTVELMSSSVSFYYRQIDSQYKEYTSWSKNTIKEDVVWHANMS